MAFKNIGQQSLSKSPEVFKRGSLSAMGNGGMQFVSGPPI
jgi:hypothetical protein